MKRLSIEKAQQYLPKSEDLLGLDIEFFTLIPDIQDPQWDIVTYYTGRNVNIYSNREGEGDSWLYILTNPSMPFLLKIGYTKGLPSKRAKQVSRGTGVPLEFELEYAFKCFNSEGLEREVHKALKYARINKQKEFFKMNIESAIKVIEELGEKYV